MSQSMGLTGKCMWQYNIIHGVFFGLCYSVIINGIIIYANMYRRYKIGVGRIMREREDMNRRELFNTGWRFARTALGVSYEEKEIWLPNMQPVALPHDWLIWQTDKLYEDGIGWYARDWKVEKKAGERIHLRFDGVYMDSALYVNDRLVGEWKYGYSTFEYDVTDALREGDNLLVMRVVHQSPNSRWYSGAGIYRNVWLVTVPEVHIASDGIYVSVRKTEQGYELRVESELSDGQGGAPELPEGKYQLRYTLSDDMRKSMESLSGAGGDSEEDCAAMENRHWKESAGDAVWQQVQDCFRENALVDDRVVLTPDGRRLGHGARFDSSCIVNDPHLWDVEDPYLYTLRAELMEDGQVIQRESLKVGFCSKEFTPEEGFLLNGRKLRLNGVCEHHDLGALGAAFSREAMRRKFLRLRSMGVNALRTSHNMPAPEVMELADELGFLVVAEAFDMWEMPKTQYDYARFFADWAGTDVRSWVRRDRSHVSLLMWSLGNEIYDTHASEHGQEITRRLMGYVREHDPRENAPCTIGSNFMPWEGAQKCADIVGMAGYNYAENYYEAHRREHPQWVIYGSETASVVKSRGIYHFPLAHSILTDEDEQCSSLGNSATSWGAKCEEYCITMDRDTPFSCGQFLWTGFDYIGEPTPYQTKNSYFGQIDTAGIPKDAYYIYKGEWTDGEKEPFVHIFPYWDFNEGQSIDVRIASNQPKVELFVDGISQGTREIRHEAGSGMELVGHWILPYEPGTVRAVAYDREGRETARECRSTSGDSAALVLRAEKMQGDRILTWEGSSAGGVQAVPTDRMTLTANGEDLLFVEISTVDKEGRPVENAADYVEVEVTGPGRLVGLDNGDSTDYDPYKGTIRKLFSGKLLAIIATQEQPGEIRVTVRDARESVHLGELPAYTEEDKSGYARRIRQAGAKDILKEAGLSITVTPGEMREGLALMPQNRFMPLAQVPVGFVPVRKLELVRFQSDRQSDNVELSASASVESQEYAQHGWTYLGPHNRQVTLQAICHPANATDQELIWKAVNASGIETNVASVEAQGDRAVVTALGDGKFNVRCMVKNGTDRVKLISQMEFVIKDMGPATMDPYSFVVGGLFNCQQGTVLSGIANAASTAREGLTAVGYSGLDFGDYGSDEVTVSIFANSNDPQFIQFWEGLPGEEGSELLYDGVYHKQSQWQVFQPETYKLKKRLRGQTTLCICTKSSMELGGFTFTRINKAFQQLHVVENRQIYGDSFTVTQDAIEGIGNNVSLEYADMDFGEQGVSQITICGRTPLANNTIHVRFVGQESVNQIVEFPHEEEYTAHSFALQPVKGVQKVVFVFLPGCDFDFKWFKFETAD